MASYLCYKTHVCGLASVLLAGNGGMGRESFVCRLQGWSYRMAKQRKAKEDLLGEASVGVGVHRRVM